MNPTLKIDNLEHFGARYSKVPSYNRKSSIAFPDGFIHQPDGSNYIIVQFMIGMLLTVSMSLLAISIACVVGGCPNPQMIRIHTVGIIASWTIMKHVKRCWYRAFVYYPACSVGTYLFFVVKRKSLAYLSIARGKFAARPQPARFSFANLFPKSLRERLGKVLRGEILLGNLRRHKSKFCFDFLLAPFRRQPGGAPQSYFLAGGLQA